MVITCSKCGKHISAKADKCPGCGCQIKGEPAAPFSEPATERNRGCMNIVVIFPLIILLIVIVWLIKSCHI